MGGLSGMSARLCKPWDDLMSSPTQPSGARLPYRICMCPLGLMGFPLGLITSCPAFSGLHASMFSASVLPAGDSLQHCI